MLSGDYVVINELKNSIRKKTQVYNFLTYILKETKIPPKNDYDMDF